jgi:hypothetical protein
MIKPEDNVPTALHDFQSDEVATISLGEIQRNVKVIEISPFILFGFDFFSI